MALNEPLQPTHARKLLSEVLNADANGSVSVTSYFQKRLAERSVGMEEALAALRTGTIHEPAEWRGGRWRYRVHGRRLCVVIQFETESEVTLITVWPE